MCRAKRIRWSWLASGILLAAGPVLAQQTTFNPGNADDSTQSMAQFIVWVRPEFRAAVVSMVAARQALALHDTCFDYISHDLTSPVLYETPGKTTLIGRSVALTEGDASDIAGISVGASNPLPVSSSDITVRPAGSEAPGEREVHTKITRLLLKDRANMITVRAGNHPDVLPMTHPLSPGEVESKPADGFTEFPALSFFNTFVEVDLPGIGTLLNDDPLLVINDPITQFPPRVIYIHGQTDAVAVYRKSDHALFGYLRLAGHGLQYRCCRPALPADSPGDYLQAAPVSDAGVAVSSGTCIPANCFGEPGTADCADTNTLIQAIANAPRLPCPQCVDPDSVPALGEWGLILLTLLVVGTALFQIRRRRSRTAA